MKKRSVAMMMSMLALSAALVSTTPVMAKTDDTEETTTEETTEEAEDGEAKSEDAAKSQTLEDGVYTAEFDTDSSMFHVNEAMDGKGWQDDDPRITGIQKDRKSFLWNG